MSDQSDRETMADALGVYSVDAEDQLQPEDTLDGEGDVLDRGYRVGERYRWANAHGVTADEQSREETIEQRLRQEVPDPYCTYEAVGEGSSDGDSSRASDREGGRIIGRIVEPDEGSYPDHESRMVAREGRATSWDSPEEAAMHYADEDDDLGGEFSEAEWSPGRE